MAQSQYEYVKLTGVIVPDTATTRAQVIAEYKLAFGQDLDVSPETPQGLLITAETLSRDAVLRNNAALANQINPNLAGGIFLDDLLALTGSKRSTSESSTVLCDLTGAPSTVIPAGVTAKTTVGDLFQLDSIATLDGSGLATGVFSSVVPGEINAPAGSITEIVNGVLGWETVNNPDAATVGTLTQSDQSARLLRRKTLSAQGKATPEAIQSALRLVPNVKSQSFLENVTSAPLVIENFLMKPHSIFSCVDGGTDQDVANTLWSKKSDGADWNGDLTVLVTDPTTGIDYPVTFQRPEIIQILVRATIKAPTSVADPVTAVKESILAYQAGLLNGEEGLVVGQDVSPFELSGAINIEYPSIFVQKLEVSYSAPISFGTTELFIEIFQKANIQSGAIQVIIV